MTQCSRQDGSQRVRMSARRPALVRGLAFALTIAMATGAAAAQTYPDRPIKMVVGFSAGGGTDVIARIVAQAMSVGLHQSVVVENRPGVSGMLAAADVARAAPDGYTIMMGSQTTLAVAPTLYRKFSIDAARDFAGIARAGASPLVLVVNPKFPVQSVRDVIALAKAKPGTLNYASGGVGTTPHMAGELFAQLAGIKLVHVAYRGEAPALNDVIGGQVPLMFTNLSASIGNIKGGSLRALAVTGAALAPGARRPDAGGSGDSRFRGRDLVRGGRAGPHAARDPRAAQCRGGARLRRSRYRAPLHRSRHDARRRLARGARRLRQVRDREVGQGDQGRRHPRAGVAPARIRQETTIV